MRTIVVFGAGMSSSALIDYLLEHSEKEEWRVRVGDRVKEAAENKVKGHPNAEAFAFDVSNEFERLEVHSVHFDQRKR